jgi:pimeloyl-ACP methyl ester carboxylesterase
MPASSGSTAPAYAPAPLPEPDCRGRAPEFDVGAGSDCGHLTVAENRERPSGRTIRIPVARLRAQSPNPKPDPIVFLAGGPGGSGLLEQSAASGWNADRDVIFISQRGTLKVDPFLSCPEIDEFTARSAHLVMADPATSAASAAATSGCRDRYTRAGWALAAYNTAENAADGADLRTALGIDKWNVYGVSYGSGTYTGSPTEPISRCRCCAMTQRASVRWFSTEWCRRRPDRWKWTGPPRRPDTRRCSMPVLVSPSATELVRRRQRLLWRPSKFVRWLTNTTRNPLRNHH